MKYLALRIDRPILKLLPLGSATPQTPAMSPDFHVLRRGCAISIAAASVTAASGLFLTADIYKNLLFLKLRAPTSLVFDFINKLKELELTGDRNAKLRLEEFSKLCNQSDFRGSLNFEQSFLELAKKDFELLTPLEYADLSRLHEDRNRCAHPSMQSIDESYTPTAELARYHLRNAVVHFIGRPPVQGKAALDRIWSEIKSEYFPTDQELALRHFQEGPLARAKDSLIRSTVIGLTKDLLQQNRKEQERVRQFSALNAIYKMYSFQTEKYIQECLPDIIRLIEDSEWNKVIDYIKHLPVLWELMGSTAQIKAYEYIRNFVISLSWRIAIGKGYDEYWTPKLKSEVDTACEIWRRYLLGESSDYGPYAHHIFFFDILEPDGIKGTVPDYSNFYFLRVVDGTLSFGEDDVYSYVKLPGLMIISHIYPNKMQGWKGTNIESKGILKIPQECSVECVASGLFGSIQEVNEMMEKMSKEQRDKITTTALKNQDRLLKSKSLEAILADKKIRDDLKK